LAERQPFVLAESGFAPQAPSYKPYYRYLREIMARDPLVTTGIAAGETATEIVNLALANVGIQWTVDGCTDFAWGISNLAGVPFFDLTDKTTNGDPRLPQDVLYSVPRSSSSNTVGDGWTTLSVSGSVNINSVATLKSILQPGDIVRVYGFGNTTETSAKVDGKFLAHEFIVVSNAGGNVQVVDNWSSSSLNYNTQDKIVLHSFDLITNAFASGGLFNSAYVSRIDPSFVTSNFDQNTLAGHGFGNFSNIGTQPDLAIGTLAVDASVRAGGTELISFNIVNSGTATAAGTSTKLYLSKDAFIDANDTPSTRF
jgi:hypothetical protein